MSLSIGIVRTQHNHQKWKIFVKRVGHVAFIFYLGGKV